MQKEIYLQQDGFRQTRMTSRIQLLNISKPELREVDAESADVREHLESFKSTKHPTFMGTDLNIPKLVGKFVKDLLLEAIDAVRDDILRIRDSPITERLQHVQENMFNEENPFVLHPNFTAYILNAIQNVNLIPNKTITGTQRDNYEQK